MHPEHLSIPSEYLDEPFLDSLLPCNLTLPLRFKKIRAVVAGASGGVGRAIVQRLVSEGVPVTALVRDINKAVRPCSAFTC